MDNTRIKKLQHNVLMKEKKNIGNRIPSKNRGSAWASLLAAVATKDLGQGME
jgi:hypothetical protein